MGHGLGSLGVGDLNAGKAVAGRCPVWAGGSCAEAIAGIASGLVVQLPKRSMSHLLKILSCRIVLVEYRLTCRVAIVLHRTVLLQVIALPSESRHRHPFPWAHCLSCRLDMKQ